jgi:acetylornithine deacetylase/succinyl-diaminopimelate desuccinylase-like protein
MSRFDHPGGPVTDVVARRAEETLDLLARLVAEPSVAGSPAVERCLDLLTAELEPLAASVERPCFDGLSALVARFGTGAPALTLSGHVDVVPADEAWRPWQLRREGDRLVGRGACDMKAGVAAYIGALRVLGDLGADCRLELALTGDEEVGSRRGTIALLDAGLLTGPAAVCAEPTGLDVFVGNRGLVWAEVEIRGRGGHAGFAHALANPLLVAAELARALHALELTALDERFEPPRPSLTVTRLAGDGGALNLVPDAVTLALDRRLLPGENPDEALAAIERVVAATVRAPFAAELRVLRRWPPYVIAQDEPVAVAAAAAARASGRPGRFGTDLAANDSSWLAGAGIPTVLLGPGEPEQAHTTRESIPAADLAPAVEIYARLALALGRA